MEEGHWPFPNCSAPASDGHPLKLSSSQRGAWLALASNGQNRNWGDAAKEPREARVVRQSAGMAFEPRRGNDPVELGWMLVHRQLTSMQLLVAHDDPEQHCPAHRVAALKRGKDKTSDANSTAASAPMPNAAGMTHAARLFHQWKTCEASTSSR